MNRKTHWENIYHTKELNEVSWYQPNPKTSLDLISSFDLDRDAAIIDIGGGDSFLVDHLLDLGYTDITILDISEAAIERAKERLGDRSQQVKWIVSDIVEFTPDRPYDLWHDRAAFHFLTEENEIDQYLHTAQGGLSREGYLVVGTFSEDGPKKCSGIEVHQYSRESMTLRFQAFFERIKCILEDHSTPFGTLQNFVFCSFRKSVLIS